MGTASVHRLRSKAAQSVASAMDRLNELHNDGAIDGIAVVVLGRNGQHEFRVSGRCCEQPELTTGILTRMAWRLSAGEECNGLHGQA
jgi:hypothetical protein